MEETESDSEVPEKSSNGSKTSEKSRMKNPSKKDADLMLQEFKEQIADLLKLEEYMHQDYFLKKWLIAREWNVKKAVTMFRESAAYKERMDLPRLLTDYTLPEVIQKYWISGTCGFDKEGAVIRVEMLGHLDLKGMLHSARKIDLERSKLLEGEEILAHWRRNSEQAGRFVDGVVVIANLENVTLHILWKPGFEMYMHLLNILEDNYPELVKAVFVVNAPPIVSILYRIGHKFLTHRMRRKLHILGSSYQDVLLKYIDPDQLPKFMGGTQTDPDGNPRCVTKIGQGGKIPESYYLKELSHTENLQQVTVPRSDKLELRYPVDILGSVLRWEFKTDDYDIAFGVDFVDEDGETQSLVKVARVNSHMAPEDGSLTCDQTGTYIIIFDNTFSWTRSKEICYYVDVIPPDVEAQREFDEMTDEEDFDAQFEEYRM